MTLPHTDAQRPTHNDHSTDREGRIPSENLFVAYRTPANLPATRQEDWAWQAKGRCVGYPSDVFFCEDYRGKVLRKWEARAKSICLECPVQARCLEHAVTAPEVFGVWGATTPRERAEIVERRHASVRHTVPL